MSDVQPPKSPTLLPPRKSVELEDPGAHDLESSNDEEDVFSDAHDVVQSTSRTTSPIPTTRVEKVDDVPSHGQVPGTAAYQLRTQDAVPDKLEIIPEGTYSREPSSQGNDDGANRSLGIQIPKTVVEKIDLASPSYGDVPGTASYEKRTADAVPDVILQVPEPGQASTGTLAETRQNADVRIPTTIITKVDSEPSHGEVPDTDAYNVRTMDAKPDIVIEKGDVAGWPTSSLNRSSYSNRLAQRLLVEGTSPIAADGGFGPMDYDEDEDANTDQHDNHRNDIGVKVGDDDENIVFGDDFDDFEEEATTDDFGDFDDGFQERSIEPDLESEESPKPFNKQVPTSESPFPLLDFSNLPTLDSILSATSPHLTSLFTSTKLSSPPTDPLPSPPPLLSSRSLSLWTQLIAPPPLQPPNWVRSRIRRLFLVSLGVPVDLDEILPASKQKKLILPFTSPESLATDPGQSRKGSVTRLKQPTLDSMALSNYSTTSLSSITAPKSGTNSSSSHKRRGPLPPPPLSLPALHILTSTTPLALQNMSDTELDIHVKELEEMTSTASLVLEYWLQRREESKAGREAFEGVIASHIKFARGRRGKSGK